MRKCTTCGEEIPAARLKLLPNTKTCTKHSVVDKNVGVHVTIGTGEDICTRWDIMDAETHERLIKLRKM